MKRREKLQPIDYLVIVGGPLICLAIIWLGIRATIGPTPRPNPVQMLRENAVQIGTAQEDVVRKLGRPSRVVTKPDGTVSLVYTRTVLEATGSDSLDEAVLDLTPNGRVEAIKFDRSSPPTSK